MKKTPIQKLLKNNQWLRQAIIDHNKKNKKRITAISSTTLHNIILWKKVTFNTKFEILATLIDLWLIRQGEYTTRELFWE